MKEALALLSLFSFLTIYSTGAVASEIKPAGPIKERPMHYLMPKANFKYLQQTEAKPDIVSENKDFLILKLTSNEIHAFSHKLHEQAFSCGGLMVVEDEIKKESSFSQIMRPVVSGAERRKIESFPTVVQYRDEVESVFGHLTQEGYQEELTKLTQFPDRYSRGENGVAAANYLADRAQKLGNNYGRPDLEVQFVATGGVYLQNSVLVRLPGSDSTLPSLVVGGHFDTFGNNKPGADDDGSGTATVMQILEGVLKSGIKFKRDLHFAFYAAEEFGLHGSKKIVDLFVQKGKSVRGKMQFDMTGFNSPSDGPDFFFVEDFVNPDLTRYTKMLLKNYLSVSDADIGTTFCNYACSDHASWHRQGFPAVFPFEASFNNYNRTIHTTNDGLNLVDFARAAKFVKLGAAFMVELGEPVAAKK